MVKTDASGVWRVVPRPVILGALVLVVLIPTVADAVQCYWCTACDKYVPEQTEQCPAECGVWYSTTGDTTTVSRGCVEFAETEDVIYEKCDSDLCNAARVARCVRCPSAVTAECENVICPTSDDQCYLNPTDGKRGCTSDQDYVAVCSSDGGSSCTECSFDTGQGCNDVPKCVVCNTGENPECVLDPNFVRQCPMVTDQCYRYRDSQQTLHLGCTSEEDYLVSCADEANCQTCSSDACNLKGSTKRTHRGCLSDGLPPYNPFKVCSEIGCNDAPIPYHLQCFQCEGCTSISEENVNYCSNERATRCFTLLVDSESGPKTLIRGCDTDETFADCTIDRNCEICEGDRCNGAPQTVTRFCDQCEGVEECEQVTSPPSCQNTAFTNRCYLYSDGERALQKGCLLDLEPAEAEACYDPTDTRCSICKDPLRCNRQHCVRCDTRTDGMACLLGDKNAPRLRYALCALNCRMEIDAQGHTVRGCAEDFVRPCELPTCVETFAAGSNVGVFPIDRRQCYQCEGDDCWSAQPPENGRYCQLYRGSNDGCYIYNDGSTVVRGCTTDPEAKCADGVNDPHCTVWLESLTNDEAQTRAPITCFQDCPEGNTEAIPTCPPVTCPPPTDRCYFSVSNSGVISRGCTAFDCPSDSRDCYTCKEPNCNGALSVCSTCDTSIDGDCTVGVEHGDVCEQNDGCFQYRSEDEAKYGCAEQAPDVCLNDIEHCNFCSGTFCNDKALSLCYSCTDCRNVLTPMIQSTKLCGADGDLCITAEIEGIIVRDCRSDLPLPYEDYTIVQECSEVACNNLPITDWTSCYVCTDCFQVSAETETMLCLYPSTDECFTKRDDTGVIVRGCATEEGLVGCDNGFNCNVCSGENCNDLAIPQVFSCVQCNESEDCINYNVLSECPNSSGLLLDSCVTYSKSPDVQQKGCLSSLDLYAKCNGNSNQRCTVSSESAGNARPVRCIDCRENIDCILGDADELDINSCQQGSCVSFLDENGTIVRGNIVNHPECRDSDNCLECFNDVCNVGLFPADRLQCYQCSGEECARLSEAADATITPEPCARYDQENAACYTWYASASSARRGCLLDDDDSPCGAEDVACITCAENGCNTQNYSSFSDTSVCVQCASNRACEQATAEERCSDGGGCYTFFSALLVVAKGCVSELAESMEWYDECVRVPESDRCQRCFGDYCNRNRCYTCSSAFGSEANCIEPRAGLTESTSCEMDDVCVAFVDDNGHTVRGCGADFPHAECSASNETCQRCTGDHCNGAVLPKDRIKCYQCSGDANDCLLPPPTSASYCDVYLEGEESCYTYFQDERTVERGCTSQRSEPCEQHCQKCNTTGCNNQNAYVENTLSCAQCSADECPAVDAPIPAEVTPCAEKLLLGRTDHCYTYFVQPDGSVRRGCLSDLTKSESTIASQCLNAKDRSCKLCSDDGCNSQSVQCFVCNTNDNADCADSPAEGNHQPYLQPCGTGQCVALLEGTTTWKGCSEDFKANCESEETCQLFQGSRSNGVIYPADRIRCYQCEGSGCDESRNVTTCQQYDSNDECYTYVSDAGEIFRGCLSDTETSNACTEHPDECLKCSDAEGCNNEPVQLQNELICAQCYGAADCDRETQRFEQCIQPVLLGRHDSCYVQSFAGEVLARGCLSDAVGAVRDKCESASSSECSVCDCDRCNGPPVKCVSCEAELGCGDVLGVDENMLATCETGSCVSFVNQLASGVSIIAKGCSERYEQEMCRKRPANESSYHVCNSSGCNDVLFPVGRIKCYQCKNEACFDPLLEPTICEPYRAESDKCYSLLDRQQKGCFGQLEDIDECNSEDERCLVCDWDGCNSGPPVVECIDCSSSNDPDCVNPMAVKSTKRCPVGGCVTFIDDNDHTVRGCATDYKLTSTSCAGTTCHHCSEDSCNNELFPANRLQCYQCSSAGCLDVTTQKPSICQRYSTNDACYTHVSDASNVRRGCLSDPASECPDDECVPCSTGDGCNSDPPFVANTHTCYQCEGADCAKEQTGDGIVCPDILLGRSDACYSWVEKYTVRRGCLSQTGACDPELDNPNCHVCTSGKDCNAERYLVEVYGCLQCDEFVVDERCSWGFDSSEAQQCPTVQDSSSALGCYSCYIPTMARDKSSLFHRGCVGEDRQAECEPETVQVCLGTGCNHRNERLQICAKCDGVDNCEDRRWTVEECRGIVPYDRRGCYLMRDSRKRVLARGCVADLSEDRWNQCTNVKDTSCITCLDNQCNHAAGGLARVSLLWTFVIALLLGLGGTRTFLTELVAIAIGQVTGPFITISARLCLILMNRRLNSNPQPFDSRKSHRIFPSISTMFALKMSCSFRRSIVDIVITPSSFDFQL
uniref:DUF753 domain-containing protein n=1 Tax=Anopheles epiroticus TaxID=199890 RepID=A0A182PPI5_9DIPT